MVFAMLCSTVLAVSVAGSERDGQAIRVATYNILELSRAKLDEVDESGAGRNRQLRNAARIIQHVRPDILLINEIDFDIEGRSNARLFQDRYLAHGQDGEKPIVFQHIFFEPVNTGVPTGLDLDNDGKTDGAADAFGYGAYPGQYGMALFSRFEIDSDAARTFQMLKWRDMPDNLMPDGQRDKPAWYDAKEAEALRLSSKSHWDVPVRVGNGVIHFLCSHPTPPVFDGAEDRNGRRNHDEIRFWIDYLSGGESAGYIVDDHDRKGCLANDAAFVILGDLNADPGKDPAAYGEPAIARLLTHPRVQDPTPTSEGALGRNKPGPPYFIERKTCDFGRIDYVLPSAGLRIIGSGVFWPDRDDPAHSLIERPESSSDHRLVWVDLVLGD